MRGRIVSRLRQRGQDEKGAVLALVALMMVLVLGVSAMAVDLGMQRVARRDMQALADGVALDLSRLVDGVRTADAINAGNATTTSLAVARTASINRNRTRTLGTLPVVKTTLVKLDTMGAPVRNAAGQVVEVTGTGVPDAVYVTAETSVDFVFSTGSGGAVRSALGRSASNACLKLGSFAAALSSTNSPVLNAFLNDALNVSVAGYQGLATSSVQLGRLATELGVGSVEELATLKYVSLRRLYLATANALSGSGNTANITLLKTLSTTVESSLQVNIADVLGLATAGPAALSTSFNVLDLVAGAAFVANRENLLDVPVLWNVPQFSNGEVSLKVIEKPQTACGKPGTTVNTAQVRFTATPKLNIPTIDGLSADAVVVNLDVNLASATGKLLSMECGDGTAANPGKVTVQIDKQLSSVNLTIPVHLTGELKPVDLSLGGILNGLLGGLLGSPKVKVDITVDLGVRISQPPTSTVVTYPGPGQTWGDPVRVGGTGGVVLPNVTLTPTDKTRISGKITIGTDTRDLVGLSLGTDLKLDPIVQDLYDKNVLAGVNGFIDNVNKQLTPLTQLLGVQLAGADLFGIPYPTCNNPSLVG